MMKDWGPFIFIMLAILAMVTIGIVCGGCNEFRYYKALNRTCKRMCKSKQEDNVGATFFYTDIEATFGECKCYGRSGDVHVFNISVNDLREKE